MMNGVKREGVKRANAQTQHAARARIAAIQNRKSKIKNRNTLTGETS